MKLFGLKTCDTCRKALKKLAGAGHTVEFIDVRSDGVEVAELQRFLVAFGNSLVNTRSTTWRGLDAETRQAEPLTLLIDHPTLMKRPVIDNGGQLTLGWAKDVQASFV